MRKSQVFFFHITNKKEKNMSKNVLVTYPIFDMDLLQNETLLKSNEHYNEFEIIEGETIAKFAMPL